jgi:hypothetical protein
MISVPLISAIRKCGNVRIEKYWVIYVVSLEFINILLWLTEKSSLVRYGGSKGIGIAVENFLALHVEVKI